MSARERFEKWVTAMEPGYAADNLQRQNSTYKAHNVAMWWQAWQAREAECEGLREKIRQAGKLICEAHEAITEMTWEGKRHPTGWMLRAEKWAAESALSGKPTEGQ